MNSTESLKSIAEQTELDIGLIRQSVDLVLNDDLYWFPVRHHSPSVAAQLRSVILKRKPKMIFIEGPHDANHLVQHIVDTTTKPPIAIYSSYRDDDNYLRYGERSGNTRFVPPRFSAWYPMLSYSPEYVAMQTAKTIGARVQLMDLPHHALQKPFVPAVLALTEPLLAEGEKRVAGESDLSSSIPKKSRSGTDLLISESIFYQRMAAAAGFRSWDEAWDSLFEVRDFGADHELFRREFAFFCSAVRATANQQIIAADGTLERERFMLKTIKEIMACENLKAEDCIVVCGGFHLFLDLTDTIAPPTAPPGTVYTSIVPYSFFRISDLSGYQAGNRAPQFYQAMWDLQAKNRKQDLLVEHVVSVLKKARRGGEHVSSADAISTCQHAEALAKLRGRSTPILDDIHDALITCCCKGDPKEEGVHLLKAIDAADIGNKIGRVTEAMGRLPVVQDFYANIERLELAEPLDNEKRMTFTLDLRDPLAGERSVFFHRLASLEIPFAMRTVARSSTAASGTIFKEAWAVRWNPEVEATLVERSLLGDTIESAALARLREKLFAEESNAGALSAMLVSAADMDLPNLISEVEDSLSRAVENDARFTSLTEALVNLSIIDRSAGYKNLRQGLVDKLMERAYDKACFTIIDVIAVPEDEQPKVLSSLMSIAEIILRADKPNLDSLLFVENVRAAAAHTTVPFLRGVLLGILTELRVNSPEDLAKELLLLVKSSSEILLTAGDFLDGMMAASRTSMLLGSEGLIAALDQLLRVTDYQQFLVMLPKMRGAFERLHESQRDTFAQAVARRYGLEDADPFTELNASTETASYIAHIDFKVSEIMKHWSF